MSGGPAERPDRQPDRPSDRLPGWLGPLAAVLPTVRGEQMSRFLPPAEGVRRYSAVLVLFGEGPAGPDLLLIERAAGLRSHAGQPAFPGGAVDPADGGPVEAALREAAEEVGLEPGTVEVLGTLPDLWLPPSGYVVTPVVAWWRSPHPVRVVDAAEVAAVLRVPLARLADPGRRLRVRHPNGWVGPAFDVDGLLVWGFTAGVVDRLLAFGGWERPWDASRVAELAPEVVALARASSPAAVREDVVAPAPEAAPSQAAASEVAAPATPALETGASEAAVSAVPGASAAG